MMYKIFRPLKRYVAYRFKRESKRVCAPMRSDVFLPIFIPKFAKRKMYHSSSSNLCTNFPGVKLYYEAPPKTAPKTSRCFLTFSPLFRSRLCNRTPPRIHSFVFFHRLFIIQIRFIASLLPAFAPLL